MEKLSFTPLTSDEPTSEELNKFHKLYISGSQIKNVINNPQDVVRSRLGKEKLNDTFKYVKQDAIDRGIHNEFAIFEKTSHDHAELKNAKLDKRAFKVDDKDWMFNIDGFVGDNINNVKAVLEIKNTGKNFNSESELLAHNKERGYVDQIKYYCLVLGCNTAYIATNYNNTKDIKKDKEIDGTIQVCRYDFTNDELNELKEKLDEYTILINNATSLNDDSLVAHKNNKEKELEIINGDENIDNKLEQLFVLSNQIEQLESEYEDIKNWLKENYANNKNNSFVLQSKNYQMRFNFVPKKISWDIKKIAKNLNLDFDKNKDLTKETKETFTIYTPKLIK